MASWVKWNESSDLCFKFSSAESSYSISFTNLSCIWKEEKTEDEISQKSEILNPSIEASNKRIVSIVESTVKDEKARQRSDVYLSEDGNRKLVIKMKQRLENLPFIWEFEPELQMKEALKEDVVLPLLYSLVEMEYRERELIHVIKRKDAEIEDYKATGAKVSRKQLETKPFEESKFSESLGGIHRVGVQSPSDIFSKSSAKIFSKVSSLIVDGELKPNLSEIKAVAGEKKTLVVKLKQKEPTIMESDEDRRRKIEEQLKKEEEEEKMKKKKRKIKL